MVYLNPKLLKTQSQKVDQLYTDIFQHNELVLYGPTESAKTLEALKLAHTLCSTIKNFQATIIRKAKTTIYSTALQTLKNHILPHGLLEVPENPVSSHGGMHSPVKLIYKDTGAELWFLGEDDKTGKALGTEWDLAIYSQCEQASPVFWQQLSGRCTGRAGNWKVNGDHHGLLLGECNPASHRHHLRNRWKDGRCKMIKFLHVDNPMIYYDQEYTKYGKKTTESLKQKYTGVQYERLYLGNWKGVEGQVYPEYDPNIHEVEENYILEQIQDDWVWTAACDHGHTHAFVYQLYVGAPDRSVLYLFKEVFKSQLDVDQMKERVFNLIDRHVPKNKKVIWTMADHRPEINKSIEKLGIIVQQAQKEIIPGVETVRQALHQKKVFFNKDSLVHPEDQVLIDQGYATRTTDEFEFYAYKPEEKMNGSIEDEKPDKSLNADNGMDPLRYELVKWTAPKMVLDGVIGMVKPKVSKTFF